MGLDWGAGYGFRKISFGNDRPKHSSSKVLPLLASDTAKGTDAYVCLCFTRNHPMSHIAMNDERKLDPVYLEIDPRVIKLPKVMITNAPSNQNGVERVDVATALDGLDLEVIYKRTDWSDATVQARLQAAEKYEILIPGSLDKQYIIGGL